MEKGIIDDVGDEKVVVNMESDSLMKGSKRFRLFTCSVVLFGIFIQIAYLYTSLARGMALWVNFAGMIGQILLLFVCFVVYVDLVILEKLGKSRGLKQMYPWTYFLALAIFTVIFFFFLTLFADVVIEMWISSSIYLDYGNKIAIGIMCLLGMLCSCFCLGPYIVCLRKFYVVAKEEDVFGEEVKQLDDLRDRIHLKVGFVSYVILVFYFGVVQVVGTSLNWSVIFFDILVVLQNFVGVLLSSCYFILFTRATSRSRKGFIKVIQILQFMFLGFVFVTTTVYVVHCILAFTGAVWFEVDLLVSITELILCILGYVIMLFGNGSLITFFFLKIARQ